MLGTMLFRIVAQFADYGTESLLVHCLKSSSLLRLSNSWFLRLQ
uniref:Uncharacterized protein n=1 Tax=Arundo donax TaxID=35708 RepID=A0A0A8Z0J2_ARUDO